MSDQIDGIDFAVAAYREEGDALGAARAARVAAWLHTNVHGDWAVAAGWIGRAERELERAGDSPAERGWLQILRTRAAYAATGSLDEATERAHREALELGRRAGDTALENLALARLGWLLVLKGRAAEGMPMLDEALAAVCAGEVADLFVVETNFCGMFEACERLNDVARAEQWMHAADELVAQRDMVPVGALCRAYYAGILTAAGRWQEAETELDRAARVYARSYAANRDTVLVRLADLRVRQGRLEEAERLLVAF